MTTLTFFEQSAFILEQDGHRLAVDFGSYSSPESLAAAQGVEAALVSHIHPDHFHEANLQALNAPIYTVQEVASAFNTSPPHLTVLAEGDSLPLPNSPFTIVATPSNHGTKISKPVENIGFLLHTPSFSVYYLGDMAISTPPPTEQFDLILIPVGNRGYVFSPEEAAAHLQGLNWQGEVVPIHYHNQSSDPESGQRLAELLEGICKVTPVEVGQSLTF